MRKQMDTSERLRASWENGGCNFGLHQNWERLRYSLLSNGQPAREGGTHTKYEVEYDYKKGWNMDQSTVSMIFLSRPTSELHYEKS